MTKIIDLLPFRLEKILNSDYRVIEDNKELIERFSKEYGYTWRITKKYLRKDNVDLLVKSQIRFLEVFKKDDEI
tara:strand:- start:815 stop:1036 length:222 start_codon:yes stop_codon:yes gene_type:complete